MGDQKRDKPDNDPKMPKGAKAPSQGAAGAGGPSRHDDGGPKASLSRFKRWWPWVMTVVVVAVLGYPAVHRIMAARSNTSVPIGSAGSAGSDIDAMATPSMPAAGWLSLSLRAYQQKRYVECIGAAQTALRLQPNFPEAYNNIAVAYTSLHLYDLAIAAAQDALRLKPDYVLAKNNLQWAMHEKAAASH